MRRILVPTDLSPLSTAALHVAVRIAKRMHAEVVVLKVVPVHGGAAFDDRGELVQDNADDITPFLEQRDADSKALAAHCADLDLPVTQLVRFGPLADTILRTVDQY
ncbi:MAG TPA: universal stress protein, partial [Flavobacteriales bacterium]|nr:universal stress protein [Flavobacteriales bacterium]